MDSDKGSEGSEEVPIIDEPSTKPVDLEKVVQYSDPRVKENLEPFFPESCLKEVQLRIIIPESRLLEEVPRSTLDPRAPPFPQPNSECGATSKVIHTDSTSVLESVNRRTKHFSDSDREGLREFTDCSRTLYRTLKEMNSLLEMNLSNLGKMSSKLPTVHQARWRDEVQWIRE